MFSQVPTKVLCCQTALQTLYPKTVVFHGAFVTKMQDSHITLFFNVFFKIQNSCWSNSPLQPISPGGQIGHLMYLSLFCWVGSVKYLYYFGSGKSLMWWKEYLDALQVCLECHIATHGLQCILILKALFSLGRNFQTWLIRIFFIVSFPDILDFRRKLSFQNISFKTMKDKKVQ